MAHEGDAGDAIPADSRLRRELRTVESMIGMHCRGVHGRGRGPCPSCTALRAYVRLRVARCPFGGGKPTCANCPIHCYGPEMRERIREVMRWAGPRMAWRHPYLALRHVLDGRRAAPALPGRRGSTGRPGSPAAASPSPGPSRTPPS